MGLAERRISKEFQEKTYPGLKARIEEAAGFPVPLDVMWDSLMIEGQSRLCSETWPDVYFEPLIEGLQSITRDELGKEALQKELKSVVIQNRGGNSCAGTWATFENGVLRLDHEPTTNVQNKEDRTQKLREILESNL